jgi:hypothetical protein
MKYWASITMQNEIIEKQFIFWDDVFAFLQEKLTEDINYILAAIYKDDKLITTLRTIK